MAFASKWSDAVKGAVIAAVLDHGMTVKQATDAAHAGELPGIGRGLEPEAIAESYVRDLVQAERRRRKQTAKARQAPGEIVANGLAQLAAMFDQEVSRAVAKSRTRPIDPDKLLKLARAGEAVAKMAKTAAIAQPAAPATAPGKPDEPDFIGGLAGRS
jgi:hypothetical protein